MSRLTLRSSAAESSIVLPVNDLQRHFAPLREELLAAANRVVARGRFVLGDEVAMFEREFADFLGVGEVVGVASGTDALELGLRALGVRAGDEVVTVANAGGYSTAAIRALGAVPRYADVDPIDGNLAPAALASALSDGEVAAVVVTHLHGRMAPVRELTELCREASVPLLEDCAQAHGARVEGRAAGAWGDSSAFSFYPTKNLGALGDGGAVATRRPEVAARLRALRQYGWSERYHVEIDGGRSSRLDELQAAFLRRLLPHLDDWNRRRSQIASTLRAGLVGTELRLPAVADEGCVWHHFVVGTPERERLRTALAAHGVATDVHYPVADHRQTATARELSLPVTEAHCAEAITLPCFPELTDEEVEAILDAVRGALL